MNSMKKHGSLLQNHEQLVNQVLILVLFFISFDGFPSILHQPITNFDEKSYKMTKKTSIQKRVDVIVQKRDHLLNQKSNI